MSFIIIGTSGGVFPVIGPESSGFKENAKEGEDTVMVLVFTDSRGWGHPGHTKLGR